MSISADTTNCNVTQNRWVAVFLKDTKKYFDEVEAQTWNHQTVFCIVYLTKIHLLNENEYSVTLLVNFRMALLLTWL